MKYSNEDHWIKVPWGNESARKCKLIARLNISPIISLPVLRHPFEHRKLRVFRQKTKQTNEDSFATTTTSIEWPDALVPVRLTWWEDTDIHAYLDPAAPQNETVHFSKRLHSFNSMNALACVSATQKKRKKTGFMKSPSGSLARRDSRGTVSLTLSLHQGTQRNKQAYQILPPLSSLSMGPEKSTALSMSH